MRRDGEALDEIRRARELDPLSLVINANLGFILAGTHHYDEAIAPCRQALEMDQGFAHRHFLLGQILLLRGMNAEAVSELKRAKALSGDSPQATSELSRLIDWPRLLTIVKPDTLIILGSTAFDLEGVSQADIAKTVVSYRRERGKPERTVVAEAVKPIV